MSALGSLVVKLSLEHAEFSKGLDKSSQEALRFAKNNQDAFDKFSKSTTSALANIGKSALGMVGGLVAATASVNKLSEAFQFADRINDVAKANEVAVGSVLRLSQALSLNGGNAEDASKVFSALTASIDEAAQGSEETQKRFAALGVSLEDIRKLDGQQIFDKTLQGLQDIEDPIKRNAAAMDLLGKSVKGVDISGLGTDYANNQGNFESAEDSFAAIGEAMDRLDSITFKTSQTLAETFGPALLAVVSTVDELAFGFDKLEKNIIKARNAGATGKFTPAPKIGDKPVAGAFNLPPELQSTPDKRAVIEKAAENAQREAERNAQQARDKAARDAASAREKAIQESKAADLAEAAFRARLEKEHQEMLRENFEKRKKEEAEAEKEAYEQKLKQVYEMEKIANRNFEEAQRQARELADEAKRASDDLNRSITDALLRGFESGKGFASNFRDTLKNLFQTLVLQPSVKFLVDASGISKILGGLGGGFGGSGSIASGGGVSDLLGGIKNIIGELNGGITGSIEALGTFLSTGNGGLGDTIGGFLGQYSSQIANGFSYLGAGLQLMKGNALGAAATAIGTYFGGPIGGAIGSFLGGAFGRKKPRAKIFSSTSNQVYDDGQVQSVNNTPYARGKRFVSLGADATLNELNKTFASSLGGFLSEFGLSDRISSQAVVAQRKQTARGVFNAAFGSGGSYNYDVGGSGNAQSAFEAMAEAVLSKGIVAGIQQSGLAQGIKKFFDDLGTKEQVLDAMNSIVSMRAALVDLPPIFDAVRNAIDTTAYTTSIDALKAQFQATQTFVDLFYTDTEKFNIFTNQLKSQLDKLNTALPTSRDQYRAMVEAIKVNDEATRDQFNGLVALAPAMDKYFNLLNQQAEGINEVNQALADGLNQNLFSTYADYASARASAAAGLSPNGFIGDLSTKRASGDAALVATLRSLVAQQAKTDQILSEIAEATRRTREINERWNGDGLPETRVI